VNGDGFAEILRGLGATDILVYKKVKPSVHQIQNALIKTRAKNIITAADDADILASLKSAITLCKSNIELIETYNIISIISMMYNYSNAIDVMQNAKMMRESLSNIKFCKIARATRNFEENNLSVRKGDFFTIYQDKIILSAKHIDKAIIQSISEIRENESLVTLYKGRMNKNDDKLMPLLKSKFSNIEFEIYNSGQDRYNYYVTFE
jgi:dihydroxyacetone kinase-like predicted kinase